MPCKVTRAALVAIALCATCLSLRSRSRAQAAEFEAATVKPAMAGTRAALRIDPGRLTAVTTLRTLVLLSYGIEEYQLAGGPAWASTDLFSVAAVTPGPSSRAEIMAMLRSLLAKTFQLKMTQVERETPVYLMTTTEPPKLKPWDPARGYPCPPPPPDMSRFSIYSSSIPNLLVYLNGLQGPGALGAPVLDRTGLQGTYAICVEVDNDPSPVGKGGKLHLEEIPEALKAIGLTLTRGTSGVQYYTIVAASAPASS